MNFKIQFISTWNECEKLKTGLETIPCLDLIFSLWSFLLWLAWFYKNWLKLFGHFFIFYGVFVFGENSFQNEMDFDLCSQVLFLRILQNPLGIWRSL